MNSSLTIIVEGGCVQDVSTNVPGLDVTLFDIDLKKSGEDFEIPLAPTYTGPWDVSAITDAERDRFDVETSGNHQGSKTTVDVLLHIISDVPAAAAAFREWLEGAEQATRELEEDFSPDPEDDPDHDEIPPDKGRDTFLNHLACNGPWPQPAEDPDA